MRRVPPRRTALLIHGIDVAWRLYVSIYDACEMNPDEKLDVMLQNARVDAGRLLLSLNDATHSEEVSEIMGDLDNSLGIVSEFKIAVEEIRRLPLPDVIAHDLLVTIDGIDHIRLALDVGDELCMAYDLAGALLKQFNQAGEVSDIVHNVIEAIHDDRYDPRCSYCGRVFFDAEGLIPEGATCMT